MPDWSALLQGYRAAVDWPSSAFWPELSKAFPRALVVLSVRDHGPGIEREEQDRIFERFYRARGARDRNVRGSGIGLSLVKHIAEAHGGRVTVECPGVGSIFRVHLPAPVPEGAEAPASGVVVGVPGPERS